MQQFVCPMCLEVKPGTDDPNHANHVAFGEAVCSEVCHHLAYSLDRYTPYLSIVHDVGPERRPDDDRYQLPLHLNSS